MELMEIPDLAEAIRKCPASVAELSRKSGISRQAIMWIRDGRTDNPGVKTVQAIQEALDSLEKQPSPDSVSQSPSAVGVGS